jgi:Zn-dependent M28 family amino/carboxypeptidase
MEGRATGSVGAHRAARFIAEEFRAAGLEPAGDSGYFQRVALVRPESPSARSSLELAPSFAARDSLPEARRGLDVNVIGRLTGSDPVLKDSVVLIDAHFDHIGMTWIEAHADSVRRDSIFNGADDDASGVVAVIEIARHLAAGPRPKRTIIFTAMTGEEVGLLGTRWYMEHPVMPIAAMQANLEIEMIGRPDTLAGGKGRAWLTGYERSTMGEMFAAAGIPIGPDRRPEQSFFARSDNIAFAQLGIPAHTISSFNMHRDYHQVTDDVSAVDFEHMAAVIDAATKAAEVLANGPAPTWKPGGKP